EYWNWPQQGEFIQSYYHETYGEISVDFNQEFYNWDAISPTMVNADVEELLYHAGVAVRMNYGPNSSSAQSSMISTALRSYFRYQDATRMVWRSSYTAESWRTLLHAELSAGRPVIYRGQGPNGGHAYDVDGVQDSTWFHINWGWSGTFNGYFLLDDLSPGNYYFGDVQGAVIGIAPDGMALNHQPVVASLQLVIRDGETARATLSGYDADGDELSYSVDGQPIEGQAWSWRPRAGKCGTYVFAYQACDAYGCGQPSDLIVVVHDEDPPHWVAGPGPDGTGIDTLSVRPDSLAAWQWSLQAGLDSQSIWGDVRSLPRASEAALADQQDTPQPANRTLRPAYPNPFNPSTTLPVDLAHSGHVRVSIYNVAGQRVALLQDGNLAAGHHELRWSADQLASGLYLAVLETGSGTGSQLLHLLK
ncbi:MAG: C10 family peptidase, partial [Candidatus Delongbacteria bacterium]